MIVKGNKIDASRRRRPSTSCCNGENCDDVYSLLFALLQDVVNMRCSMSTKVYLA
ncbi:hypothetical protein PF003_g2487 [Phytophthora fragariae]|nr:hypothetical protein PF003_g2487 [Phytophthora fragariae]